MSKKFCFAYNSVMENINFWEFSLKANLDKSEYILYLKDKIKNAVKTAGGIITTIYTEKDISLLIGLPMAQKMALKPIIYSIVTDILANVYKIEYIVSRFNFEPQNSLLHKSFVKALCVFDSDIDKQIVYQKLINLDSIDLQSFFDFRLKVLKAKWKDLIDLANDNYLYLLSGGNLLELMKFLLSNLDCKANFVEVFWEGEKYKLFESKKQLQLPMLSKNDSQEDLLASLIAFCPKKIVVYNGSKLNKEVEDILFKLFENRVEIIK